MNKILVKVVKCHENAKMPVYSTSGAAGFDLHSVEDVSIYPGNTILIKTGLKIEIPAGYEIQIRPRSGTSLKTKIRIANSPGTIDSDFRGEVCIIAENTDLSTGLLADYDRKTIHIKAGERIAQGVLAQVPQAEFVLTEEEKLNVTDRGSGGFGSTGK